MNRAALPAVAALAAALIGSAAMAAAPDCDRACLKGVADGYFDALAAHDAARLPAAPDVKFTENGERMKLGDGFWKTGGRANYRVDLFEPERGGIGVESVVNENGAPVLYVVRLKVVAGKIAEVETIVGRKGAYGDLWGPENLKAPSRLFSMSIRPAEQDSRLTLMAAADGYFRAFETNGSPDYHPAPLIPGTERYENGVHTTNAKAGAFGPYTASEQFDRGLFKGAKIFDRRYPVVDLERGVVMSIVRFGPRVSRAGKLEAPLVMEAFAVQRGQIQEIHAILVARPPDSPTGWLSEDRHVANGD